MKRNMVPLLGIAFVVAIISTGVFYGLFAGKLRSKPAELPGQSVLVAARDLDRGTVLAASDLGVSQVKGTLAGTYSKPDDVVGATLLDPVQQNEPLLQSRVASRDPKASGAGGGIAAGMRAVSIRVAESSGLMSMLHAGSRVDLQAVTDRTGISELRTILQNVEVLRLNPQLEPAGNNRPAVPVATVLVPAQYADAVALADTGARLRITLRNPLDDSVSPRYSLGLAALFGGAAASMAENKIQPGQKQSRTQSRIDHAIQLHVQVFGASAAALGQLDSELGADRKNDPRHVVAFRAGADAAKLINRLQQTRDLEVVSSSNLTVSTGHPANVRATAAPYHFRVQFSPAADSLGKPGLLVQPEISLRRTTGVETRRYDAALPEDASFLVKGLFQDQSDAGVLARLFPEHSWGGRELVIFVTARSGAQDPSAIAQTRRGR